MQQEIINQLQKQGYSEKDIQAAMSEQEGQRLEQEYQQLGGMDSDETQTSTFQYNPSDNLIKWQLELNDILERAEHILREDIVVVQNGQVNWKPNPEPEKTIFNKYGVQEIMRILSMYINRNTILSDFEPNEINDKIYDFGKELNDLIFMKYENFGLTNLEKRKNYPMLVRQLIDIVHSAYKRALYGGERTSLREARQIQQTEQIMPQGININTGEVKRERGFLNPMRYVRGKYAG